MKKTQPATSTTVSSAARSLPLGDYAHHVIAEQYHRIVKYERRVLADKDPEHLHQMRVGTRRLRTALQVFDAAIELPKAAQIKRLSQLARVLGKLRDLDVQTATLKNDYCPRLNKADKATLQEAIDRLAKQRRKALAGTQDTLNGSEYKTLKAAYEQWLTEPRFKPVARMPLMTVLPELLVPLLAHLLMHPAWLVATNPLSADDSVLLHDLRKTFKHVRYQAEFFVDFYGPDFSNWVQEVKTLQDALGEVQDSQILLELLMDEMPKAANLPEVQSIIDETQANALKRWEIARQQYLDPAFRQTLRHLILEPELPSSPDPEQN